MDIGFASTKLARVCNSEAKLRGHYGPLMARKIQQRLGELAAADTLQVMKRAPGRTHQLTQNLAGKLAIDLVGQDRLVFRPDHDPIPELPNGGLDWTRVTRIVVEAIGDYH